MKEEEIREKMDKLSKEIAYHKDLYYNKNTSEISDYDFDFLVKELEILERTFPHLSRKKSITRKVGASPNKNKKQKHDYPMLSLTNTYSKDELEFFYNRICRLIKAEDVETFCELKIDGVAVSLIYKDGKLIKGATRGDGLYGENIYDNVLQISSIPQTISYRKDVEIRGEVFITKPIFEELNAKRIASGEEPWANARNLASGTIKLLDKYTVKERNLSFFPYSVLLQSGNVLHQSEIVKFLTSLGFSFSKTYKKANNLSDILDFIEEVQKIRGELNFESDGVVIKVNSFALQEYLGQTTHSPKWAVAYKYKSQTAFSQLKEVVFQVGRTGAITPVAIFDPVTLSGSVVHKASLHNKEHIAKLNIFEKDTLEVEKGGEVIPKIIGVDKKKRISNAKPIEFIEKCPSCNSTLVKTKEKVLYCKNYEACPDQQKAKVLHFVSKNAMNISSLGKKTVDLLFKAKMILKHKDLYKLTYEKLSTLPGFKDTSIKNILESIEESKKQPFYKFIFGLGIKHVGEVAAKAIVESFTSLEKITSATKNDFLKVNEVGDALADSLYDFFNKEENKKDLEEFKEIGINMYYQSNKNTNEPFYQKNVVISGTFPNISRAEFKNLIEMQGGKILSSVSKKLDFLIIGENPSATKIERANALGIKVLKNVIDIKKK